MKIVRDVPGERLTLEGAWVRSFPVALVAVLGLAIVLIGFGPLEMVFDVARRDSLETGDLVGVVLAGLFTAFVLGVLVLPRVAYRPYRLDVDRTAGEVRFVEKRTVGKAERVRGEDEAVGWELGGRKALRKGDWKIVYANKPWGSGEWELYDLASDRAETRNLAADNPQKLQELLADWKQYVARTGTLEVEGLAARAGYSNGGKYYEDLKIEAAMPPRAAK